MSILLLLGVLYVEIFLEELTYLKFSENMDWLVRRQKVIQIFPGSPSLN